MDGSDLFAKVDQQISALKERIARQHEVIKQAKLGGRSTAAAETIQHALHQSLRAFEKHRQQVFERMEAKRKAEEDLEPVTAARSGSRRSPRPAARASAASHRPNVEARGWFLCRKSDAARRKKPRLSGIRSTQRRPASRGWTAPDVETYSGRIDTGFGIDGKP